MKLATWNLRHGGRKGKGRETAASLVSLDADVLVLTEYRPASGRQRIEDELRLAGWIHQASTSPPPATNGLLVASREPLEVIAAAPPGAIPERWIEIVVPSMRIRIFGVHVPGQNDRGLEAKKTFWDAILSWAGSAADDDAVVIGDFNTGLSVDCEGAPFKCGDKMQALVDLGWTDAWRTLHGPDAREYTWWGRTTKRGTRNGFRLDYAFLSPHARPRLRSALHDHSGRLAKLTDHAALVVDLE